MNPQTLTENALFQALQENLRSIVAQLRAGEDIAPARRLQLEGFAAALVMSGADIDVLAEACVIAGANSVFVTREGNTLHFDCWQQRAPVYPSTST